MAAEDPVFESLQRIPSMMESFDESLSQLCKDNISESALDLRKNLTEYYHDLHKALQLKYETLNIKEEPEELGTSGENKENKTSKVTGSNPAISSFTKVLSCADVRSEIKTLCDKADGRGLRNYIIDNMKEVKTLRNELPLALCEVPDAAKLVMNALEPPFFPNRKPYIVLLESLYKIFGNGDSCVVPSDVKDSVREFAKAWREEVKIEKNMDLAISSFTKVLSCVDVRSDIKTLCDKADGRGLRNYIINNMKEVETLRNELPVALREVPDAVKLVMNALEPPFFPNRKPYIVLLESLYKIFGNGDSGVVPSDVKDSVREFAKAWREEVKIEKNMDPAISSSTKVLSCVDVRSDIKTICDKADGRGLRNYIINNMKEVETLRNELPVALREAPDAVKLVMNALDPPLSRIIEPYNLLLESLYKVFDNYYSVVPSDVKDSVREFAKAWRKEVEIEKNTGSPGRANIRAFLKFLASFRIAEDYERDELWGLLLPISRHVDTPQLCRSLGLTPNVSEFIDKLSKIGKHIEALRYANAFDMLDKVDHVDLLTSYLRDVEKAGKEVVTNAQGTAASQTPDYVARLQSDADNELRAARRTVIKLVRIYGLRSDFFDGELRKLEQEEEDRIENKKTAKKERKRKTSADIRSEIKTLCDKGDGRGLRNYITDNMRELVVLRNQLLVVLREENDAAKLVMNALEPPFSTDRKACILLLECLYPIFGSDDSGVVPSDVQDSAREIAKAWRKEMKIVKKLGCVSRVNMRAFLKFLASFRIAADYERDDLWGLLLAFSSKVETPDLCRRLGLSPYISEFIDKLSKTSKHTEALRYADAFGMLDKKADQEEEGKKAYEREAEQEEDGKKAYEKKAQEKEEKEDRKKAAEKKVQEKEDGNKDVEKKAQHKRRQSFKPGYGLSERENYASKRAKDASLNETSRVAGGIDNSKASPYNIDGVQNKYGIIGHDHHTSAFTAANTGLAAGAFTSAPSIAAQINNERRHHEEYPLAFGTSNRTPIGSSLYSSSVPACAFAFPLSNVAEVNYEGRGQQSYPMNFGEVDKNHVRTSVYGTRDLANSFATQSNYNFEGRGEENYQLNFGEIHNNPVRASAYVTGVSENSSATQCHYERSVPELYTSTFGGGSTAGIVSSVYGSNPRTIPSVVNQGSHERSFGQSSGFAGRNMVSAETAGYESGVSTVPPSSVNQGHFEKKGSVIDRYRFNSGLTSLSPAH